jgi:alkylmercury lyase-like protein
MSPVIPPAGETPQGSVRAERLSAAGRQLHRAVLTAFIATGQPPTQAELERIARGHNSDPSAALAELAAADIIAIDGRGDIRAAYPFSPVATPIRVSWDGGPRAYAMCAIDALGISAMLGKPVTVTAADPETGRSITVAVDGDRARWRPRTAVVFSGAVAAGAGPAADLCCGYINFFTSARAARVWAGRHPEVIGTILRRDGALRFGIEEFGSLLRPAAIDPAVRP